MDRKTIDDRRADEALRRTYRALNAIRHCCQVLVRATDEGELLRKTCQGIVERAGYRLAWVGLAERDEAQTVRVVAAAGYDGGFLDAAQITWADTERGRGPTGTAIRTGQPVVVRDTARDPSYAPWRAEALRRGYASTLALPLKLDGDIAGALNIYAADVNAFDAEEVTLLGELANDLAFGINALRARAQLRQLAPAADESPNPVLRITADGRIVYANHAGAPVLRLWQRQVGDCAPPEWQGVFAGVLESGTSREVEFACEQRVFSCILAPNARAGHVDAFGRDITERKRAEDALRLAQFSVERASDAVFWTGPDARVLFVNDAACRALGYTRKELLTKSIPDLEPNFPVGRWEEHWRELQHRGTFTFETTHRTKDGRIFPVEITVNYLEFGGQEYNFAFARDITERKRAEQERERLEAQLRRAQKMEAIGQLAGGVAHDFNNILTAILGNVELLRGELDGPRPGGPGALACVEQLERAAQRAAGLTRQMLAFSRHQTLKREVLDLHQVLTSMETMLRRLISENISLEFVRGAERALMSGDAGQVEQVIMNLIVNARDAMPAGGRLVIETNEVVLDDAYVALHPESHCGPHILLTVSDTGCGMTPKVLERIFEPFFTTKPIGQGTGLGLATVYAIVKQLGGHVMVYSEPGIGTTFRLYLPASAAPEAQPAAAVEAERSFRGSETILVCEDDEIVRNLAAQFLREAGYTLLDAVKGSAALELAGAHPGPIHLLVTDVIMPDINGRQLSDALTTARPGLKTLFISGYTSNVIAHHGVLDAGVELLEKPFGRQGLLARVRELLDRTAT